MIGQPIAGLRRLSQGTDPADNAEATVSASAARGSMNGVATTRLTVNSVIGAMICVDVGQTSYASPDATFSRMVQTRQPRHGNDIVGAYRRQWCIGRHGEYGGLIERRIGHDTVCPGATGSGFATHVYAPAGVDNANASAKEPSSAANVAKQSHTILWNSLNI